MAQPYDLSSISNLQATILQMQQDQTNGAVNFAGGDETWIPNPAGWFNAILTSGGSPSPTTIFMQRTAIKNVRTILDILAGGTGSAAANAVQTSTPPSFLLETGRSPTGPNVAFGPLVNGATTVANTSYDLSGVAALQTTVNTMLADQQSGVTSFTGWGETWKPNPQGRFLGILYNGVQTMTMGDVLAAFTAMQRQFDLLAMSRGTPTNVFQLDFSLLDGGDVLG